LIKPLILLDKRLNNSINPRFSSQEISLIHCRIELRTDFATEPFRDVKKLDEFLIAASLKPLSDVGHDEITARRI
jgi:hypothetical protein